MLDPDPHGSGTFAWIRIRIQNSENSKLAPDLEEIVSDPQHWSREKLLNCGLEEMDWTLVIDRTWVLHLSDQLFNCHNCLTVCRHNVKSVWWLSENVVFRRLILHAVVAVSCLLVCCCCSPHTYCAVVAVRTLILCCCCSPHSISVRTATVSTLNITWISCFLR